MTEGDTIIAQASAPGRSDRALLRASGPACEWLASTLSPTPAPRTPTLCDLPIGRAACPVIATLALAPATYTGEDTLELLIPGNPALAERILDAWTAAEGVRRAGPGEFTARAYLNTKLSLDQAEGVAALISARSAEDLAAADRLARGQTGDAYRAWAEELATLLALVEAGIDFTDQEDVVPIAPRDLRHRLALTRDAMLTRAAGETASQAQGELPLVALVGPPNAGKSTLFNALLGRTRAVVADERGTTRDVLTETLHLDESAGPGLAVTLADLPGLDTTDDSPTSLAAQTRARDALTRADALVCCDPQARFDPPPTATDIPTLRVRTKADLPGPASTDLEVCALDGRHLDALRRGIADIALRAPGSCAGALARHARAIAQAGESLTQAIDAIDAAAHALDQPELTAQSLRTALDRLEEVVGRVAPDDVIGRVFATFCVGK